MSTPDPLRELLEGLLPGNPLAGEPPIPRFLIPQTEEEGQAQPPNPPTPVAVGAANPSKPACTAADESLLAYSYLDRLANGAQGFGVLRQGKEHLEAAAKAAEELKRRDIADKLRDIAAEMPNVRDGVAAAELADRLEPLTDECWELGRGCNRPLSIADVNRAIEMAEEIKNGRRTYDSATTDMRETIDAPGSPNKLPEPDA